MMSRRGFLEMLAGGALGALVRPGSRARDGRRALAMPGTGVAAAAGGSTAAGTAGTPRAASAGALLRRVGLQLYTVRSLMARDFEGTLDTVASIGYREVEFAGYFDRSPAQVRAALDRVGLDAPATHVGIDAVRDGIDATLESAARIGHRYVIVASLPARERSTLDGYRRIAEEFNRAGERARAAGLRFAFHNHDSEFAPIEARVPYEILVAETDPELVAFELDLYWITKAGRDPLDYFARFPGRFELVHVKDMDDTPARGMVDVGRGIIDFPAIFAHARQAGIRHWFVEHDQPVSPVETIRVGYEYVRGIEG